MSSFHDFNIPTISTTPTPTKSIISNEISPQPHLLCIEGSNGRRFTLKKTNEDEEEENPTIPLTEHHRYYTKDMIIKQGLVLCTRTEEWYTKRKSTMREVQLRKTRLRWRQFKAVLKRDRIELYHITTLIITASKLAHVIYLNNQYPYRKVKLSLISPRDYIWSLEFNHYETKSLISYQFQSTNLSEAQDWYMSVYHVLPFNILCKNPIPPLIDIYVLLQREQQQQETLQQPLIIRIPLEMILKASHYEDTQLNINTSDIKPVIWKLFKKKGLLGMLNVYGDNNKSSLSQLRLCWRSVDSTQLSGDGAASAIKSTAITISTPTTGEHIEWISENSELIGPQLIEQKHRLELRTSDIEDNECCTKAKKTIVAFDGLLIHKQWQKQGKCKKTTHYGILYGHHLFFLEKSYFYYYKRLRDRQLEQHATGTSQQNNSSNSWFSATTGGIYLHQHQKKKKAANDAKKKNWQHVNHSTPNLTPSNTETIENSSSPFANTPPDPIVLINSKHVLDLNQVSRVQPMQDGTKSVNTFEVHTKRQNQILYYEAPNTQIMLEWITIIGSKLKLDPLLLLGHHNGFENHQSRPENVKDILQSGLLYVKQDFEGSFQPQHCILAKNKKGSTLMMFNTLKNKKQWWLRFGENSQQREFLPVYTKSRQLIQLEDAYIYSGDPCIMDKLVVSHVSKTEPARYYKDGAITGGDTTSDCVFVIWKIAKKHFVPNFREYLSLLKLGHHLGNRGTSWVFKARSRQERDEWVWALHKEFGILQL